MRLFVAVSPGPETTAKLDGALGERPSMPGLRWIDPGAWHITLQFLGNVDDDRLDEVRLACAYGAGRVRPFAAEFGGLGAFPSERRARVLWIGAVAEDDRLAALATAVQGETSKRGFEPEGREFKGHLTIGRLRQPCDVGDVLAGLGEAGPVAGEIEEVLLYRSHLHREGARYEVLDRFPLRDI